MAPGANHEAGASVLGYLYQIERALYELLCRSRTSPNQSLFLERIDDILFDVSGSPVELLQTKHRVARSGSLIDTSRDLWRTLGGWSDAIANKSVDPATTTFTLLTTSVAPDGSAAAKLRQDKDRLPVSARLTLERIARTDEHQTNRDDYTRFSSLTEQQRGRLIEATIILDGAPGIVELRPLILGELRRAAEPRVLNALADRLFGWWYRRIVEQLRSTNVAPIRAEELENQIDDLRDQLANDNLPIDVSRTDASLDGLSADDRQFVRQLELIAASDAMVDLAIRDFKRAVVQRDRWIKDGLLLPGEIDRYWERLIDEWEHHDATVRSRHPNAQAEDDLVLIGTEIYNNVQGSQTWIRARVQEPFVVRGSYHQLADDLKVGWHPDFVARLRARLAERGA